MKIFPNWQTVVAAGLGLGLLGGCTNIPDPPAVTKRATLTSFAGKNACSDLEQYIEDNAVLQMRTQLEAQRDGVPSWGWWGWAGGLRGGMMDLATPSAAGGAENAAAPPAPTDYTQTNNQVAGVDEADFVKNDGTRIFVLSGDTLYANKSWPAAELAIQGRLKIEGWPREMFIEGTDQAVVFSSVYRWYPLSNSQGVDCLNMRCGYFWSNTTKVTVVDVSDLSTLRVTQEYYLPGNYESARKVGSSVRMVISDNFNFPPNFKWSPDYEPGLYEDKARLRAAYDKIIADDEKAIRSQTLAEWVPAARSVIGGQETILPHPCSAFSRVNAPTRLGTVSVVTLDLATPNTIDRTSILAEPGEIYASASNLYIATRHWWWWPAPGQRDTTYLHKFDITQPDKANYVASGTVDGHLVDQFSMDENQAGFFRVATTIGTRVVDAANAWGRVETTNRVSVLGENDGALEVVGQSEDLATGERIMSARFIEDKGFITTFRQVDPLFTFDMSDPRSPKKLGELTVPGFSNYMHPIDATHLLTIGTFVPPNTTNWMARALQLAIFDVSDMHHPQQTFTQLVGTSYGWSEAQYEHKAFNYFPAKKLLAIPFYDWNTAYAGPYYWDYFTSDLRVYGVDTATGFTPKGAVSMRDLYQVHNYYNWSYYWTPSVRRSVMADDFVYAISDSGIRVSNIANLSAPISTALFDRAVE